MSDLTNPADGAADGAARYTAAVLDLLGSRDALEVLRGTPMWLQRRVADTDAESLSRPEADGRWSVVQVLHHLADSELVWGYRLRLVLAEDRPVITGFDQDRWARNLGYEAGDAARALRLFEALRMANLALVEALDDAGLKRVGVHRERGEESVEGMLRLYAGHDLAHRAQIERVLQPAPEG